MKWKDFSLFGRKILENGDYAIVQEIIRTQNFGTPVEPFKGAIMQRQDPERFKTAISKFVSDYKELGRKLIENARELSSPDREKAVELLKRCEKLNGMAHTFSQVNEAFRGANVEAGKDYAGLHASMARRLEIAAGGLPVAVPRSVVHQDHSFR